MKIFDDLNVNAIAIDNMESFRWKFDWSSNPTLLYKIVKYETGSNKDMLLFSKSIYQENRDTMLSDRFIFMCMFQNKTSLDFLMTVPEDVIVKGLLSLLLVNDNVRYQASRRMPELLEHAAQTQRFSVVESILYVFADDHTYLPQLAILSLMTQKEFDYAINIAGRYREIIYDNLKSMLMLYAIDTDGGIEKASQAFGFPPNRYDATIYLYCSLSDRRMSLKQMMPTGIITSRDKTMLMKHAAATHNMRPDDFIAISDDLGLDSETRVVFAMIYGSEEFARHFLLSPSRSFRKFDETFVKILTIAWMRDLELDFDQFSMVTNRVVIECGLTLHDLVFHYILIKPEESTISEHLLNWILRYGKKLLDPPPSKKELLTLRKCMEFNECRALLAVVEYCFCAI